jgi:uncharacterized protein (TIGR03086 family)
MTNNTNNPAEHDDPRTGLTAVAAQLGDLIGATPEDTLSNATPCPEFNVKDLQEHVVMVMRRVAAIGRGEHWSSIDSEAQDSGWHEAYLAAKQEAHEAWADPAKLGETYEVPWGELPGAPLLYTYTAELSTHGWDLATATDRPLEVDDDLLHGALVSIKFVPAEGRDDPDVPFSEVVDPGPDAPLLLQIAGWGGRQVS